MSRHPREFRFWHQRLDVFRVAIRFVRFVESIETSVVSGELSATTAALQRRR